MAGGGRICVSVAQCGPTVESSGGVRSDPTKQQHSHIKVIQNMGSRRACCVTEYRNVSMSVFVFQTVSNLFAMIAIIVLG